MNGERRINWSAEIGLILVTVVWGTTFIVNAETIGREPPLAYITLRFAIAAVLLAASSAISRRPKSPRLISDSLLMGGLLAFGMASQIVGQTETSASKTAFITGLSVVLTPFFALYRTRKLPRPGNLLGVAFASAGFFLLSWPAGGGAVNRGDLMVLACAVFFAFYIVENAERAPRHDTLLFTTVQIAVCAAIMAAMSVWLRAARPALAIMPIEARPLLFDRSFILAVAYMATFATIGTFAVQTWAQTKMSATHAAILFALEPVWTAIFAAFVLSERLCARALTGGALVIAGIVVSEVRISAGEKA
jgi:drug/metabolite transporter (DMT)-like permease